MNKREQQYQKTLEAIRQSVDELVLKEGFDKLTIRGVCKKAGINHGTFYHYFNSKDDLIMDRQKRFNTFFADLYETRLQHMTTRDALKLYSTEYIHYIQTRLLPMLISFEKTLLSISARGKLEENSAQTILMKIIEKGKSEGEILPEYSTESLYNLFQIFYLGIRVRFCHTYGESLPDESTEREILKWIDTLFAPEQEKNSP